VDEVFGRRDMIAQPRLKELSVKSDLRGFIQLGSHVCALALSGAMVVVAWGTAWAVPAFIVHGTLINFLYAGQHELSHWTVFRTKALNELFGRAFGFILIYPRDFDQVQHFADHRFTQDWQRDGELARERYTLGSYLMWLLGPSYWYSRVRRIVRFSLGVVTEPSLHLAKDIGAPFVIVVGQVMPLAVQDMIPVVRDWLRLADDEFIPIQFETHRNCITNDLFATLLLLNAVPEMRLSADLSHYVVDREMMQPISATVQQYVSRVLARSDSSQGHVATRNQVQVPIGFAQHRSWLETFLQWWKEGFAQWRARAGSGWRLPLRARTA
jgi:hypothetical protein